MPSFVPKLRLSRSGGNLDSLYENGSRETPKRLFYRRLRRSRQFSSRLQSARHESTGAAAVDAHRSYR
jgi:hypothetical protein